MHPTHSTPGDDASSGASTLTYALELCVNGLDGFHHPVLELVGDAEGHRYTSFIEAARAWTRYQGRPASELLKFPTAFDLMDLPTAFELGSRIEGRSAPVVTGTVTTHDEDGETGAVYELPPHTLGRPGPYYGVELTADVLDTTGSEHVFILDVGGFQHLDQVLAYAESLRGVPAEQATVRASADGHKVSTMNAAPADVCRPFTGATVYLHEPRHGATWHHDLASWDTLDHAANHAQNRS